MRFLVPTTAIVGTRQTFLKKSDMGNQPPLFTKCAAVPDGDAKCC